MNCEYILFDINCPAEITEILIAELDILDINSFLELDTGFEFSISKDHPAIDGINILLTEYTKTYGIKYSQTEIGKTDWNLEWEKNFQPVTVENSVLIRAPFHTPANNFETDIIIAPKMSFGTGHHETTYMMIQAMMGIDFKNKDVLDAGCGTGILSIFARKTGSGNVTAIDIDDWAVSNAKDNIALNELSGITVTKGSVADLAMGNKFWMILANINRNVLLGEMPYYARCHLSGGVLILSGFYEHDAGLIAESAQKSGYIKLDRFTRNGWSALVFNRNSDYFS